MAVTSLYSLGPDGQGSGVTGLNSQLFKEIVFVVREFMRDFPQLNRLTKGRDHSRRLIMWATLDTLSDWASTPPFVGQNLDYIISRGWQHLFIRGITIALMESLYFLHLRNYLSYSAGGVNVQTENPQMLMQAIQMMKSQYEQKKKQALIAANIEGALQGAGVYSEYAVVNTFWGAL